MTVGTPGSCGQWTVPGIVGVAEKIDHISKCGNAVFGFTMAVITGGIIGSPVGAPESAVSDIGGMFQGIRDYGGIDTGKAALVTGATVHGSGVGQGIGVVFLEVFDGMDGILACSVDMTGAAVNCIVMGLPGIMAINAE